MTPRVSASQIIFVTAVLLAGALVVFWLGETYLSPADGDQFGLGEIVGAALVAAAGTTSYVIAANRRLRKRSTR